jgi:hypothetical protein
MNEAQLRQIITQQKNLGRSPEELIKLSSGAGVDQARVMPLVLEMFPGFSQTQAPSEEDYSDETALKIWDPAGKTITETTFFAENTVIQKKFETFKAAPYKIRRNYYIFWSIGFAGTGLILSMLFIAPELFWNIMLGSGDDDSGGFGILTIPWLPLAWYVYHVKKLQRDLVKKLSLTETIGFITQVKTLPVGKRWLVNSPIYF